MWTFYELKSRAKTVLRVSYFKSLLAVLICTMFGSGISLNTNGVAFSDMDIENIGAAVMNNLGLVFGMAGSIIIVSLVISVFLNLPLMVGQTRFFNEAARGNINLKEILYPFTNGMKNYLNIVKVCFMKTVLLFLWGLIAIIGAVAGVFMQLGGGVDIIAVIILMYVCFIPMLIKSFQYYFVEYILTDEPGISWREAISKSKSMTDGNKWRMFLLTLSFLGWLMLGAVCFGIGAVFVIPYIQATFSELYLKLKNDRETIYSQNNYEEN